MKNRNEPAVIIIEAFLIVSNVNYSPYNYDMDLVLIKHPPTITLRLQAVIVPNTQTAFKI